MADGVLVGECGALESTKGCPVNLTKGQDYDFHGVESTGGLIQLVNPMGQVTISQQATTDGNTSTEFGAAYTGTYQLRVVEDCTGCGAEAGVQLFTDCRRDAKTTCLLPVGGQATVVTTGTDDVDGVRSRLTRGRVYTYTYPTGDYVSLL